eukprot:TRINITY_DN6900_c1_g1_i1.p1 TRINITY_DN6900_c1_g1~~TRINITY_DN6900_c1_g1_i1.p1  ORF type:complete len:218 (-),score=26.01 TRINITY_DN6900_c1_g1_i1:183-836(-)
MWKRMANAAGRGALIVFEGVDRCGKSTQVKKLGEYLAATSTPCEVSRFPNRETPIGKILNSYLTNKDVALEDRAVHLLFSANRWECRDRIVQVLNAGTTVVLDRYAYSGVAFTSAKGIDLEWCKDPDRGLPEPDVVIYMQLSIEDAAKRGEYGQERYENVDFQRKVEAIFQQKLKDSTWVVLDGRKTIDELHLEIQRVAGDAIARARTTPVGALWSK